MSDLTDLLSRPPWLSVERVGDVHPSEYVHGLMRTLDSHNRQQWTVYLYEAHRMRLLMCLYPEGTSFNIWSGWPDQTTLDESRIEEARNLWSRKHWGPPESEFLQKIIEMQRTL